VALNLDDPGDNRVAITKLLSDRSGEVVYAGHTGTMYAWFPDRRIQPLLQAVGFITNRSQVLEDGTVLHLQREVAYYADLHSGEILTEWDNPLTGQPNLLHDVVVPRMNVRWTTSMPVIRFGDHHDGGDTLNAEQSTAVDTVPLRLPWTVTGDLVTLTLDAMMHYPNPLPPLQWPRESTGDMINPSEHYTYFTSLAVLEDPEVTSAPFHMTITRVSPWLPWMLMGTTPGHLMIVSQGYKLASIDDLDPRVRAHTQQHHPDNLHPPDTFEDAPNVTSWERYATDRTPA
jgi:hypothetical protein